MIKNGATHDDGFSSSSVHFIWRRGLARLLRAQKAVEFSFLCDIVASFGHSAESEFGTVFPIRKTLDSISI